jgi:hypothetical protein
VDKLNLRSPPNLNKEFFIMKDEASTIANIVNRESFSVKSWGSSLNRAGQKAWAKIAEEAFGDDPHHTLLSSPPTVSKEEEREWLVLVYEDKPVGVAAPTVDRGWIERKKENVGFIDDFMIIPTYIEGAAILIEHCLSRLRDKGVEEVMPRSRKFPALQSEEFEVLPPFALPNNPAWYVNLFCDSGFTRGKEWVILYIPTLPSPSKLSPQIEPDTQQFLRSNNAEFRKLDIGNRDELKQYSDLMSEVFIPHFGYNPRGLMEQANSFWRHMLIRIMCRLLRIRIYVALIQGEMVAYVCWLPDITIATKSIKRRSGVSSLLGLVDIVRFITSIRKINRVHVESIGLKQDIRNLGYVTTMLDYGIKLIVDEGYEDALLGPMLVENLPIIKVAAQRLVAKVLEKEEYATEEKESVLKHLWHTIYSQKEAPERGGEAKILRYCTLSYRFEDTQAVVPG